MKENMYRNWLQQQGTLSKRPISDYISRCRRVEKGLSLDLDDEYDSDRGHKLLKVLIYSADDEKLNKPAPKGISFAPGSNIKNGMSSLRSAVKNYFKFCKALSIKSYN